MNAARIKPAQAAFGALAMPVVVAASADQERHNWATTTIMYVSFVPPQVCVALHPGSRTLELVRASGELSLSLLSAEQANVAMDAGRRVSGKRQHSPEPDAVDAPDGFRTRGVAGALAVLWCRVVQEVPTADHVLLIANVIEVSDSTDSNWRPALLRFKRRYHALGAALSEPSPEGYPI